MGSSLSTNGIIGWWKFDEAAVTSSPTTVVDSGSSPHNGTLVGGPLTSFDVPSVINQNFSLGFNKTSSQYMSTASTYNIYPLTVSFWIKTNTTTSNVVVGNYSGGSLNGWQIFFNGATGRLVFYYFKNNGNYVWDGDAFTFTSGVINNGAWHNIIYTIGPAGGAIYTDGVLSASLAWTGTPGAPTTANNLELGGGYNAGVPFNFVTAMLTDIRIFNSVISSGDIANIQTYTATSATPVSWWKVDSANIAFDSAGFGNNGSYVSSPTVTPSTPSIGYLNPNAITFNGSSSYVTFPKVFAPGSSSFSITGWFKSTGGSGTTQAIYFDSIHNAGNNPAVAILIGTDNKLSTTIRDAASNQVALSATGAAVGADSTWHHVAITYDATPHTLTVYLDGSSLGTNTNASVSSIDTNSGGTCSTGAADSNATIKFFFAGSIDDLRFFKSRVLSSTEVSDLYLGKYV